MKNIRPNILLVLADDLGWGDLGCYGATRVRTPNIDALARRGATYRDAHAASSVCSPSRYAILTGRYPWRSPLKLGVLGGSDPCIIGADVPTVASRLEEAGYRTGAFGKWHLGLDWVKQDGSRASAFDGDFSSNMEADARDINYSVPFGNGPLSHGFERFFGIAGSLDMPPYCFLDQDRAVGMPAGDKEPLITSQRPGPVSEGWADDQADIAFTEAATAWIGMEDPRPFFAYVAAAAPHRPCVPPAFVRGTSEAGLRGDSIHLFDWMVGQLVSALEPEVLAKTLIIVTSDNGAPTIFPEDGDVVQHRPNGPWRGQKADAYEGGHRVPLVMAGPGVEAGVFDDLVSLLDLLPSVLGIAGVEPHVVDGVSLFESRDYPVLGAQAFDGRLVLRSPSHKVIYGSGSGGFSQPVGAPCGPHGEPQVYDLVSDPGETMNLGGGESSQQLLTQFLATTGCTIDPIRGIPQ